jgi:hypothetical protein
MRWYRKSRKKHKRRESGIRAASVRKRGHQRASFIRRTFFIGELKFARNRTPKDSVSLILAKSLAADPQTKGLTLEEFFGSHGLSREKFWNDAACDWRDCRDAGDRVHSVLKLASYQGSIDDLWSSVFGTRKPSGPPQAGTGRRLRGGWVHFYTGTTRKPGSHRS